MAEEQVMPQHLVLDSFSEKLRSMQLNNLTAKQQTQLEKITDNFFIEFKELSYSFFGLSESQWREFSTNELKALDKLISSKARPRAICQMLFTFGVPIFGWLRGAVAFADYEFVSWYYLHHRRCLRKIYGEELLPEVLKMKK